ncbi:MAG: hypothetical protein US40_C0009G0037 [Candidatus Roizmanbacteria bacterium GW2011_GWC2_37_13]|uniref:Antitoxin n=1 Tax=Candidatus Roizmanbacteria bacterium GW2011_GWC2_37_13 TaxID=1618486 RepID=A0A0G0JAQ4_9BACT|nr:MAG: hypothetical protein US38_C0009G0040 [Candidatus Roizmanbacteria bacterium GW2011_GWC1_37_12]KKQ25331.1 MAG: hypothetical protein US40_C0009G0037 [Candidatus Roizmanbacteria bacterium GW2011_GWC2_37_13]
MQQSINMLDFRKSPGNVINEVYYNKKKIILERGKKPMVVMVPVDLYKKLFQDEDIEIYTKQRVGEFKKEDKLAKGLSAKIKKLLK